MGRRSKAAAYKGDPMATAPAPPPVVPPPSKHAKSKKKKKTTKTSKKSSKQVSSSLGCNFDTISTIVLIAIVLGTMFHELRKMVLDRLPTIKADNVELTAAGITPIVAASDAPFSYVPSAPAPPYNAERIERMKSYRQRYQYYVPPFVDPTESDARIKREQACGAGPDFATFFGQFVVSRSRDGEDQILYNRLFKELVTKALAGTVGGVGTYVDIGAYDGAHASNSRFFDECLGWKGLLLEGNPSSFSKLKINRPQAFAMHVSPTCATSKTVDYYPTDGPMSGLPGFTNQFDATTIQVPCGPLTPILQDVFGSQNERINLLTMNAAGAEALVLQTLNFKAAPLIDVLLIETSFCPIHLTQSEDIDKVCTKRRNDIRSILHKAGYKRYEGVAPAESDLYVHPKSPFQLPDSIRPASGGGGWLRLRSLFRSSSSTTTS